MANTLDALSPAQEGVSQREQYEVVARSDCVQARKFEPLTMSFESCSPEGGPGAVAAIGGIAGLTELPRILVRKRRVAPSVGRRRRSLVAGLRDLSFGP